MTNENTKDFVRECFYKALIVLMKDKNYNSITIKEICEKSGFSRMAYYRNFNEKDDILRKKLDSVGENFKKDLLSMPHSLEPWKNIYNQFFINDIIENYIKAELMDYCIFKLKELIRFDYTEIHHYDMEDPKIISRLYDAVGSLLSSILYSIEVERIKFDIVFKKVIKYLN